MTGRFCSQCGQEAEDVRRPIRRILGELLGNLLALDSRILRSLRPLVLRPGRLTVEYLAGRRIRYVEPLRLYVFASVLFFGVLTLTKTPIITFEGELSDAEGVIKISSTPSEADSLAAGSGDLADALGERFAGAEGGRVESAATAAFSYLHFFLVPAFALVAHGLYRRTRRYYVEQLIFALHFGTFAFLVVATVIAVIAAAGGAQANVNLREVVGVVSTVWIPVYLFLAQRRVYRQSRLRTLWKTAVLLSSYGVIFLLGAGLVVLTVVWFG